MFCHVSSLFPSWLSSLSFLLPVFSIPLQVLQPLIVRANGLSALFSSAIGPVQRTRSRSSSEDVVGSVAVSSSTAIAVAVASSAAAARAQDNGDLPLIEARIMTLVETMEYEKIADMAQRQELDSELVDIILHHAIFQNCGLGVEVCLSLGARVCVLGAAGNTGLHLAALFSANNVMTQLLTSSVQDVQTAFGISNFAGFTPLVLAARNGDEATVSAFLAHAAQPNVVSLNGQCPLLAAVKARSVPCLRALLEKGADPNMCQTATRGVYDCTVDADSDVSELFDGVICLFLFLHT